MSKAKISDKIKEFFNWFDDNPGFTLADVYKAFPNESQSSMRSRKAKYDRYRKEGKWSKKVDSKSNNTSIIASTKTKESQENELSRFSSPENTENLQDRGTSINAFINDLFEKREILIKILTEYQKIGSLPLEDIKLEKPFKTVSFNLMEKIISEFTSTCNNLGVSQRKAVHRALMDFTSKYSN